MSRGMIHSINNSNVDISQVDGLLMYRFNSPLTYFKPLRTLKSGCYRW
ncbi:Uncharacterised protein [Morganella morganii]|nr:Uncharacterised protein [Morganella morganii]